MNIESESDSNNVTFRDRVSSVTKAGLRKWIYAAKPKGKFYKYRTALSFLYLLTFFALPLIKFNGMPFFMLNFPEGKFIVFGNIFWPQDFFIFAVAMITFIVFVALFTVIYGRLFCGWVCPQTIFMEMVFRRIEWWIEGTPSQQKKNNKGELTTTQLIKKIIKHIVFLSLSFLIANTFLAYIISFDELIKIISEPITEHTLLLTGLIVFTLLFYSVYAFVRDIVCTTICPYGRLQGVLFDKDTMQISYDYNRGEPRGKINKKEERTKGDCIDCMRCVHVCPTGIDIRNGVQMECVGCTACIDACDAVMMKINLPTGLIRYASENEIAKKEKFHFNGRMKAYTTLLIILTIIMSVLVITRRNVDTQISRVKGQLYQEIGKDSLSNLFNATILNKTRNEFNIELKLENMPGQIKMISNKKTLLNKESVNELTFFICINRKEIHKRATDIKVGVYKNNELIQTVKTVFLGPFM